MTDEMIMDYIKAADPERLSTYIPAYWNAHLEEKIKRIHARQIDAGITGTSFGLITDFHVGNNAMHSPALMEKVLSECGIAYFFNAGDFVSGMGIITPEKLIMEIETVNRLFARIAHKQLKVLGNHDFAYSTYEPPAYYAEFLSGEEIYEYVFRSQTQYPGRVFGADGTCFYADDAFHKMRYIVLNTHDTPSDELGENGFAVYNKFRLNGIRQEQLNWFAHTALAVPSQDWTVVLCTHEAVTYGMEKPFYNDSLVLGIINAFRKHEAFAGAEQYENIAGYDAGVEVDFTGRGGDFAAWVGGHTHSDETEYREGVLTIATQNDSLHNSARAAVKHAQNIITEQAFDIFTVNKREHKLYATRIGCGEDREFTYEVFR